MTYALNKVARWRGPIREARELLPVPEHTYPDEVMLALIEVESAGNPTARKFDTSQFYGLLQMGKLAGIDVGYKDRGRRTTEALDGDGYTAIVECLRYLDRYRRRHVGSPDRIAALWKAGPGSAATIADRLVSGDSLDDAIQHAADKHDIPNLPEYVRRFRAARRGWAKWVDEQGDVAEFCELTEDA